jgi:phenylacetate-CoA ligase
VKTITNPVDQLVARRLHVKGAWNRPELEGAQMASLRRTVQQALTGSILYRERLAGVTTESLRARKDLVRLPLLTSADIVTHGHQLLSVSQSQVARVVTLQTSGSTGQPKRLMFTSEDLSATLDFFFNGMHSLIDCSDRVLVLLPFEQADSVGELLIRALTNGGIPAMGLWPPKPEIKDFIQANSLTCAVGLPQHLLALAESIGPGQLRSMLLCSDYASPALRTRIEKACDCETFLHYGTTESGLGGGVECTKHDGCHIRESELLVEIIDPENGTNLADGQLGEVVITTLGRQAMPLLRYRTGDMARLNRSTCGCGGITARLHDIRGRLIGCSFGDDKLYSQDLDDVLFQIPGLLDYRATVDRQEKDRLNIDYLTSSAINRADKEIVQSLMQIPVVMSNHATGNLILGEIQNVEHFAATHTVKRSILDRRSKGEIDATRS